MRFSVVLFMNLELAEKLVGLLGEYPVSEIVVETEESRVHLVRPLGAAPPLPAPSMLPPVAPAETPDADAVLEYVPLSSPMVGVFYHLSPPLPFAAEIVPGQVVGAIESMKLMNNVAAERGGRVTEILIEDGTPVEYGQTLFRLTAL